jgi:hypothetical protein
MTVYKAIKAEGETAAELGWRCFATRSRARGP